MITLRPADQRGYFQNEWLESWHSFSFGEYYDAAHMGFAALRVINDDRVAPGQGFATHGHRDMEIVTYVLAGALEHKDSLGNGSVMRPGDVQRMSAGTGIRHSEFNHSRAEPVHLLQIWILPEREGLPPGYEQTHFPVMERQGTLRLVGSRDGRDGSVTIHQDVNLYASVLSAGETVTQMTVPGRHVWVQVARGNVTLNGVKMQAGDGAAVTGENAVTLAALTDAEFLLFDLA